MIINVTIGFNFDFIILDVYWVQWYLFFFRFFFNFLTMEAAQMHSRIKVASVIPVYDDVYSMQPTPDTPVFSSPIWLKCCWR